MPRRTRNPRHETSDTPHFGVCRFVLRLHDVRSLKEKRSISKSLLARARNRFNVSASEVGFLDSKTHLGLTFAAVSSGRAVIDSMFNEILQGLDIDPRFEVEDYGQEYI